MGLMAGITGHAAGVFGGRHLGEPLWLGRIFLMTASAQVGNLGQFGNMRRGIFGVLRQWTMAGFASYMGVFAGCSRFGLFVVAEDARILSRERYRMLPDGVQCPRPVVSVLSECFGDNCATDNQEEGEAGDEDECRTEKMSGIPEQSMQETSVFSEGSRHEKDQMACLYLNRDVW